MANREILYIEDNFHNRRIVRKILEREGYTLFECEDGLEGYEMLKTMKPGVVLLDISLPTMDGMEIAARVKEDPELQHIFLIALTASAMQGDRERFLEGGCDDYLSKPFRALDLVEMVNRYNDLADHGGATPHAAETHSSEIPEEEQAEPAATVTVDIHLPSVESLSAPEPEAEPAPVEEEAAPEAVTFETPEVPEPAVEAVEPEVEPAPVEEEAAPEAVTFETPEVPEPAVEAVEPEVEPAPVEEEAAPEAVTFEAPEVPEPAVEAVEPEVEPTLVEEEEAAHEAVAFEAPEVPEQVVEAVEPEVEPAPVEEEAAPEAVAFEAPEVPEPAVEAVEPEAEPASVEEEAIPEAVVFEAPEVSEPAVEVVEPEVEPAPVEEEAAPEAVAFEAPEVPEYENNQPADTAELALEPEQEESAWALVTDAVELQQEAEAEMEETAGEPSAFVVETDVEFASEPEESADIEESRDAVDSLTNKSRRTVDDIRAGIMGVINPENLKPVDPNSYQGQS